jgi:ribonucleotide reductase alpha subunit
MMRVIKRNGEQEDVSFDKVLTRLKHLSHDLNHVNMFEIAQKVCSRIYNGVRTTELDELAAQMCSSMLVEHPDYGKLASRIIVSNHHKNTSPSFSETIQMMYNNKDPEGEPCPLISDEIYDIVMKNKEKLNSYIDYSRDFDFDYFGFKTLERSYLLKVNGKIVERPQHMWMRVALGIHGPDFKDALQTYDYMSRKYFTHATPTLFNAGTPRPQCSSCYLLSMNEDSISGIYKSLEECAMISKYSGGIGIHMHQIRAKGSRIRGTNGTSDGIIPMLRVFNTTARYVNQCIVPDKMVYTKSGTKRMDEVTTDDYLVTHDGTYKKVNSIAISEKVDDELVVIDVRHATQPLKCTKVHEILTIDMGGPKKGWRDLERKLKDGKVVPKYIPADQVSTNHLMAYPLPTYEQDIASLQENDMRFYGIFIGDGSINVRNQWSVNINTTTKVEAGLFVKSYLDKKDIHYWEYIDEAIHYISWTGTTKVPFAYENFYDNNKEKHIQPEYLHLSKPKTASLLKGMMETDGYVTKTGVYYGSTSLNVIQSMKYMLLRLGILTTTQTRNRVGQLMNVYNGKEIYSRRISYDLRLPKIQKLKEMDIFTRFEESDYVLYYQYENWLLSKVTEVSRMPYTGKVYDFNMMDNHNYLTDSGLVHNSGKRNGSIAVYLEPWHADVENFIELRKNHGNEEERCRDLFLAMWVPDLFMKRVKSNAKWSLMCPDRCPGLADVYGDEFEALYEKYEKEGKAMKQVNAQELWFRILEAQIETGVPYILFKDAINKKSNQKNLGTIKSSNLCVSGDTEILTSAGYKPIYTLVGMAVNVWNGKEWSTIYPQKTNTNQKLLTVSFDNGKHIRCTEYHKFYLENVVMKRAYELCEGDKIEPFKLPDKDEYQHVTVISVEDNNEYGDTFCFNEPKEHKGIFNGVLAGNCIEICEYSSPDEIAVCNLASICLPTYIEKDEKTGKNGYNFERLHDIAKLITKNLNKVIDRNFYPLEKARRSNLKHRPIGIGVQGLADACVLLRLPFESAEAKELNRQVFETIYHGALEASMEISKKRHELVMEARSLGEDPTQSPYNDYLRLNEYEIEMEVIHKEHPGAYTTFEGSPASQGILQFDMWDAQATDRYDWQALKDDIVKYGIRNSLLIAPMPTASTAQIMGFNESFEPFTSNIFKRKTLSGEFIVVNKYLIDDLIKSGLWSKEMKDRIILNDGSVQSISEIPNELKQLYKTVWEIKQKNLIDMSADRGLYICQSQSLNLFMEEPDYKKLTSMHFYSWEKKNKSCIYYLRTKPRAKTQQFTIDPTLANKKEVKVVECDEEVCLSCGA